MKEMNFEDSIKELENIAKELESGELDLNTSMSKFEEGMKLSKKCSEILDNAEKKITILLQKDGEVVEEDFSNQ